MLNDYDVFWDEEHKVFQVRTKTDVYAIEFESDEKKEVFEKMVVLTQEKKGLKLSKLVKALEEEYETFVIMEVLNELKEYSLLTQDYFIDLAIRQEDKAERPEDHTVKKILLIGEDNLNEKITETFKGQGYLNVASMTGEEYLELKEKSNLGDYDFFVVDGHNWNPVLLQTINKDLIELKKPWLYVKGLEGAEVKVGPIFLGGELGCYNCLRKRIESNDEIASYNNNYEQYLTNENRAGQPDKIPMYNTA